jgi:hypothetical protein
MIDQPTNTVASWQDEHRKNLAAKGIEVPPESDIPESFHCRRCHRNLPMGIYGRHYKECPGFTSKCYETCPPTPPEPVERTVPPYEPPG